MSVGEPMESSRAHGAHLIARHAEATLWLARYMERIENLGRILDVTNTFARDADDTRNWLSIPRINGDLEAFYKKHSAGDAADAWASSICWTGTIRRRCRPASKPRRRTHARCGR